MSTWSHFAKSDTPFCWSSILHEKLETAKDMTITTVTKGVKCFNMKRKKCLATDWSNNGIGFFLLQKYCQCEKEHPRCFKDGWKLVLAVGRVTNPAESRYSPIEGEYLAIADALHKAKHYVLGCNNLLL